MLGFFCQSLPLWQIIGPLLLDICLGISTVGSGELLCNWILHSDCFDGLVQLRKRVTPNESRLGLVGLDAEVAGCLPFLRGNDLDNPGSHSIFINLVDEFLEALELRHGLEFREQSASAQTFR